MTTNTQDTTRLSGITIIEPLFCATSSIIIEDWLGDEIGTNAEHWEAEAYTLLRARPQIESMFSLRGYHLTVATAEIMSMEGDDNNDLFVWLIADHGTHDMIASGYALDMHSAQHDCERKMHEIAAADRA